MSSFFDDLDGELEHVMNKASLAERQIGVRAVMSKAKPRLDQMEQLAKEQAIQLINSAIMDVVDAPGCESPFRGFSSQDILVVLRKRLIAMGGLDETSFDSAELDRRLKERAKHQPKRADPRQSKP
jgi:hypothetical protein